ncbi:hypothetical protein LTR95_002369 [Oleoguttula sp. CCFEE 5521]
MQGEAEVYEDAIEVSQMEAKLVEKEAMVLKKEAELTQKAAGVAQKDGQLMRTQAKLTEDQAELRRRSELVDTGMILTAEQLQSLRTAQKEVKDLEIARDTTLAVHDTKIADLESRLRLYREEREETVKQYEAARESLVAGVIMEQ